MSVTPEKEKDFAQESARVGLNVAALVGARLVAMALALVQTGFVFRQLGPEGSGQFVFALGYSSLFTVLGTLGIQRLLVRDITRDPRTAWTYVWSAELLVAGLCALIALILAISVPSLTEDPVKQAAVFLAAFSIVGLWALQQPFEAILIARERMELLAIVHLVAAVLKLGSVIFVLRLTQTSAAAHGAIAIGNSIAFVVCLFFAIRLEGWQRPRIQLRLTLQQVRECFPYAIAMLCSLIYFKSDVSLLEYFHGDAGTGLYAPTQRFMEPLLMVAGLWGVAIFPALCRMSHAAPENYARLKQTSIRLALMIATPMGFGIIILAEPIVALFTGDTAAFSGSVFVLQLYALVVPFFYLNGIGQEFFYSAHRNWFVVSAYALAGLISVAGNLIAIPLYQTNGLALTAVIANAAVSLVFVYGLHQELGGMRLPRLLLKILLACGGMCVVAWGLRPYSLFLGAGLGAAAYLVLLLLLRALNEDEKALLDGMLTTLHGKIRRSA